MQTNPTEALSTLALVKAEIGSGITGTVSDSSIEEFITDLSQDWLQRCGVYSLSTLYTVNENYNGTGTYRLPLRQYYTSITKLTIGIKIVPQSTAVDIPGWFLDDSGRYIYLRGGQYCFLHGSQNINVQGQAGYNGIPGDVQRAFTRHCALEFKRKDSINMKSMSLSGGGSTTYLNDVDLPPSILRVIRNHSRLGM
jgi:hypothetical protein